MKLYTAAFSFSAAISALLDLIPLAASYVITPPSLRASSFAGRTLSTPSVDADVPPSLPPSLPLPSGVRSLDMRWSPRRNTKTWKRLSGASRLKELTTERRLMGDKARKIGERPIIKDPAMISIRNVCPTMSELDVEYYFEYHYGATSVYCKLEKDKKTKQHKGRGYLHFMHPLYATSAMLTFNGTMLGNQNIALGEYFYPDWREREAENERRRKERYEARVAAREAAIREIEEEDRQAEEEAEEAEEKEMVAA
ncbi:unnamed protein product [Vitrella brassicaformis CCMP3155]|uniref:RRM domain-containing protein n=1 Tax=Vitrella brassicaformis (strain CCMP3155) TaxID=1169540 RepID=A0A0G4GDP7_VITBC|nr:unnamed protein product [Vitrella brassicaformis CCMP3155]|eukprot:CEM27517.1 unnamed protein product [Vitrella brassicaformis CCMP3155]